MRISKSGPLLKRFGEYLNLNQPRSISHWFGTWLNNQPKNMKGLIWVGTTALCWAIWRCRNNVIFNKMKTNSIMQVIFRGAYGLRFWPQLQCDEQAKNTLTLLSKKLEVIDLKISKEGGSTCIVCFSPY
jgi:hypothetical protein